MEYGVEMGSCGMVYIPSFIKIDSHIQKLVEWGINIQTHRHTDRKVIS
jgi:hypothetical protein